MTHTKIGKAYIVGAGPGRADLITVRGLRLLRQAEVVIYDRLVGQDLLAEIPPTAEQVFAGKRPGRHTLEQAEINRLLVERVRAGKQVVRLKGGDPFVFGRGGEEALALRLAGLPYEIVPGVTSALAAPAYAGVPVTHRGLGASFTVVTGHECKESSGVDWSILARMPTLVVLMGVRRIRTIAGELMAAGRSPDTPSIAVSHGVTDRQKVVRARLMDLPDAMEAAALPAPAVIVIGEVAGLHDLLDWFTPDGAAAGFAGDLVEEEAHAIAAHHADPA